MSSSNVEFKQERELQRARSVLDSDATDTQSWVDDVQSADQAYESLATAVLQQGEVVPPDEERTGTGTIQHFGLDYVVDVKRYSFPILTTKKIFFDSVVAELLWFLSGSTNINTLQEHTGIWNEWADEYGDLETAYGRFWRDYPQIPSGHQRKSEAKEKDPHKRQRRGEWGIDQIDRVVENIKENPHSRRHVVVAWHPDNAWASRLPPCHFAFVFHVTSNGTLCLEVHQRSGDVALGIPFNMSSYALLLKIVADECGLRPGLMKHNVTNAHVYLNHAEDLAHQLQRTWKPEPNLSVQGPTLTEMDLRDWPQYIDNYSLNEYNPHPPIKYEVAV